MHRLRPFAVLLASGLMLVPLAVPAQETLPGEAIRRATEAAGGNAPAIGETPPTLGERLQDAAEQARDAAAAALGGASSATEDAGAAVGERTEEAISVVGLDGRAFRLDGDMVLSSAVLGQPVMTSDGVEAGTVRDLMLSLDGRVEGIVLNTGILGMGGRSIAVGADRLMISDVVAGVPRLEVSATKAALDTTPDFAPGKAP